MDATLPHLQPYTKSSGLLSYASSCVTHTTYHEPQQHSKKKNKTHCIQGNGIQTATGKATKTKGHHTKRQSTSDSTKQELEKIAPYYVIQGLRTDGGQ
jgi:hypothetical protein